VCTFGRVRAGLCGEWHDTIRRTKLLAILDDEADKQTRKYINAWEAKPDSRKAAEGKWHNTIHRTH
jgi:hypothetical protein